MLPKVRKPNLIGNAESARTPLRSCPSLERPTSLLKDSAAPDDKMAAVRFSASPLSLAEPAEEGLRPAGTLKRFSHPREQRPQMLHRASSERGIESAVADAGAGMARHDGRGRRAGLEKVDSLSSFASLREDFADLDPNHDPNHDSLPSQGSGSNSESSRSLSSARRSLSDTLVAQPTTTTWRCSGCQLPRTNATFSLVQRSGSRLIRDIIVSMDRKIADRLLQGPSSEDSPSLPTPEAECSALASCALDPYYRVIIAASGGLPSLVRAMTAFPESEDVQASGCAALASVSMKNASNQSVAGREGALEAVLAAMRNFPLSVGVQSAACDALNNLTSLCDRNVSVLKAAQDFEEIVMKALDRFLPSSCREGAEAVLQRKKAAAP